MDLMQKMLDLQYAVFTPYIHDLFLSKKPTALFDAFVSFMFITRGCMAGVHFLDN